MRAVTVFMFVVFCFFEKTLLGSAFNWAGHAFSNHTSSSLLTGEKKFCLSESVCLAIACQLRGGKAAVWVCCQQAEDFIWEGDRLSDCSVISLSELADGAGDLCYNLLSCHPRLWAHRNHQQFPHSDPVRMLYCLEKRQEGAGIECEQFERCRHLFFLAWWLYFAFLKKMNLWTRDQLGQPQSKEAIHS